MSSIGAAALAEKAKKHLGLPLSTPNDRLPVSYLNELKKHLQLQPHEDNFRVTLQPGDGFGSVTCLKDGCNQVISLKRRARGDFGRKDGFGSLGAYRDHLTNHEAVTSKAPQTVDTNKTTVSTGLSSGSKTSSSSFSVSLGKHPLSSTDTKAGIHRPSQKRASEAAFHGENCQEESSSPQISKRVKTEAFQVPLSPITNRTIKTEALSDVKMFMDTTELQDPVQRLQNIRMAIAGQCVVLDRFQSKASLSSDDIYRIAECQQEIERLSNEEEALEIQITPEPSSSTRFVLSGPSSPSPSSSKTNTPTDRKPLIARPFPMDLDIKEDIAESKLILPGRIKQGRNSEHPWSSKFKDEEADCAETIELRRASTPANFSSRTCVDLEDSSDEDSSEFEDPDPSAFMDRIGIKAPAPIRADENAVDENGDYYGRGRDLYEGPRATFGDLEKFILNAGNAETFDGNESIDRALERLHLTSLADVLPGMEVTLMPHQVIGVAWMIEKENGPNKGGCMADEMGLGKTIQMIATMTKNQPRGKGCHTTLIVAPLALLDQWKAELEEKTNTGLRCLIYHGSNKTSSKKKLLSNDVVLTTYSTLAREWPDYETEIKKRKKAKKKGEDFIVSDGDSDLENFSYRTQKRKERAGLLFQVEFHRVILDEAQNIRNRRTRISRAVVDIQTTYRWCLTGTPVINTLSGAYGYIRFLKIRPWYDWAEFNQHITRKEKKNPSLAISRLHAIMATFLLRRKKDSKLDGKPLVELPPKEVRLVKLEFTQEERDIYNMVEARNQATFNRYLRAGTVLKNYHEVLVLLLRLRQICSHASLIAEDGNGLVSREEARQGIKLEFASELSRARRLVSNDFVIQIKSRLKEQAVVRMQREQQSANATLEDDECPICFDLMTDAVITPCGHIFCRECIINYISQKAPAEADAESDGCPCCRQAIEVDKLFSRSAFEPTDKELQSGASADCDVEMSSEIDEDEDNSDDNHSGYDSKGKGVRKQRFSRMVDAETSDDDDDMSDFIVESDEDEEEKDAHLALKKRLGKKRSNVIVDSDEEPDTIEEKEVLFGVRKKQSIPKEALKLLPRFLPSSKMKYMMIQIEKLYKSKPEEKILVVSQWTSVLELVSNYLSEKGVAHVKYQGDMSRPRRAQAVKVFMSKEKARVMLMSLKCGGVGLNLTRANNVISLDLGWSQAIEAQAFDRVHRLGQRRTVLVQRVVIADTVEDRILALQERKQTLADGTLGEGSAKKMGRLTVKELANLFGLDARGRRLDN